MSLDNLMHFVQAICPECDGLGGDEDSGPCKACGGVGLEGEGGTVSMALIATVLTPDPEDGVSAGPYFSRDDRMALEALKPGTKLYVRLWPDRLSYGPADELRDLQQTVLDCRTLDDLVATQKTVRTIIARHARNPA
jgi:hypothetical protein